MSQKKILIFTATFNEINNIDFLLSKIVNCNSNFHILVIDDNSPDGTGLRLKELKKNYDNLFYIIREKKLGLDSAHKIGYNFALKKKYDYLITMDADLSHDPMQINDFIFQLEKFPFVIGSRYMPGGKCFMKGSRLFISKLGNILIRKFLGIQLSEFTTSYRGFNLKKLKDFNLGEVKTKGYSFFMGTIYELYKRKFDMKEIPITFKDRERGKSKIPKIEIIRTLKNLIILTLRLK